MDNFRNLFLLKEEYQQRKNFYIRRLVECQGRGTNGIQLKGVGMFEKGGVGSRTIC
jgi:hypothetical protein